MFKRFIAPALGLLLAVGLVQPASSADTAPPLRIGIVNVQRVLADNAQFQQFSQQYMDERKKLFDPGAAKNQSQFQQELMKRRPEILAAQERWDKIKSKFIADNTTKLQEAANQVMKDKKLDFVLMDAPWTPMSPLRQYGAVDVTTDVMLALKSVK